MYCCVAACLQKEPRTVMARKLLVCTLVVAVFAAASFGEQAGKQDLFDGILKFAEKVLGDIIKQVQNTIQKAKEFIDDVKQRIRQEEDKLLGQVPDPLGKLLKDILKKIHEAEDKKEELRANITKCITSEAQPAFDIIKSTTQEVRFCIEEKTSDINSTISDFEDLIRQAVNLVISAPKELLPCVSFPPTSETWSCVTGKVQDLSSKGMMLISSLIGDMGAIGKQVPEVIQNVINCGIEQRLEAEKKLGKILENIGTCEQNVINKST